MEFRAHERIERVRRTGAAQNSAISLAEVRRQTTHGPGLAYLQRAAGNAAVASLVASVQRQAAPAAAATGAQEVGSFSPTEGIVVDRTGSVITITGTMEAYGSEASAPNAAAAQGTIHQYWNKTFPDGARVVCTVTVRVRAPGAGRAVGSAAIEMTRMAGPSNVGPLGGMTLNLNEPDALTWTVAHEFGHQLGLRDRYSESIISRVTGTFGRSRTTDVDPGYVGNIMGQSGGANESKNVRDLGVENAPNFFTDDDQIRLWVTRHGQGDIAALNPATKVRMLNTLFDGWVSDDDVVAIETIYLATTDRGQARALQSAIEARLLDLQSTGQRYRLRVALTRVP